MVLVVVWRPLLRAREISFVCTLAVGSSQLMKLLLPVPEGPISKLFLPCNDCLSACNVSHGCCSETPSVV